MKELTSEQKLLLEIAKNIENYEKFWPSEELLENIDWEYFLQLSKRHKVSPIVYKFIYRYVPDIYQASYDQKYYNFIKENDINIKELERILKIIVKNNIEIVLVKGLSLSSIIYDDLYLREYHDIDILVKESDMIQTYRVLNEYGYFQYGEYDEVNKKYKIITEPIFKYGDNFHEFQCIKDIGGGDYICLEIKRATSAVSQEYIKKYLEETQKIKIKNFYINTLNATYTFLHLCANTYSNSETRYGVYWDTNLRDYIDLYIYIMRYKEQMDWKEIFKLSNDYNMMHKIYRVFNNLNNVYEGFLPKSIIEMFNPKNAMYKFTVKNDGLYIVDWESSFIYRLFNDDERKNEFNSLIAKIK